MREGCTLNVCTWNCFEAIKHCAEDLGNEGWIYYYKCSCSIIGNSMIVNGCGNLSVKGGGVKIVLLGIM